ncbi:VOC family protein [Muricoccus radiodurans]|uniref:VOC family protein n=1 Tax=Muricoccus radiodurans TaxID=2231721 RepID=UPI003CEFEAD9
MQFNTYLNFRGDCEAAFDFYASVLGGTVVKFRFGESPMASQFGEEWQGKIMHACLTAGGQSIMGCDAPPGMQETVGGFSVSIMVDDSAEAERIFAALAEGATVRMPIQETFWAYRFGMLVDRFGTPWMVNHNKPM